MAGKTILITGATAGIGRATANKFADNNWSLILTGRRKERLDELKQVLEDQYSVDVLTLQFDVRDHQAVQDFAHSLPDEWKAIDVLFNNAGLASGLNLIHEGDVADWDKMIDTNVKGLLYVSREISPLMVERGKGHIINVSSLAGKEVYPKGNVYASTKHAVEAITESMRIDMNETGVKVSSVSPGLVETEFSEVRFHGDRQKAKQVYQGYRPLKGEDVADVVYWQATAPDHVNIADVLVLSADQANSTNVNKGS